jgi:hypothetical protein
MVTRYLKEKLLLALQTMPVVALLGPRQVGKTTLALSVVESVLKDATYLDLESDADFNKLSDAESYLNRFTAKTRLISTVEGNCR